MSTKNVLATVHLLLLVMLVDNIKGHGRLLEPPGRSSMWRVGFNTPINYNDNQLFCGGYYRHQFINGGRCGVCGDPWGAYKPNEPPLGPGKYATGIISRTYKQGEEIEAFVQITARHKGYFEFRICPNNNINKTVSKDCLDKYLLYIKGSGTRFNVTEAENYTVTLQLPDNINCQQCVLQWRYRTGNNWGCDDGGCKVGHGPQEEFYACADIEILPSNAEDTNFVNSESTTIVSTASLQQTSKIISTLKQTQVSVTESTSPSTAARATTTNVRTTTRKKVTKVDPNTPICESTSTWEGIKRDMDAWCMVNCERKYCPETHCRCTTVAYFGYSMVEVIDVDNVIGFRSCINKPEYHRWCTTHCPFRLCPESICYPIKTTGVFDNKCNT